MYNQRGNKDLEGKKFRREQAKYSFSFMYMCFYSLTGSIGPSDRFRLSPSTAELLLDSIPFRGFVLLVVQTRSNHAGSGLVESNPSLQ